MFRTAVQGTASFLRGRSVFTRLRLFLIGGLAIAGCSSAMAGSAPERQVASHWSAITKIDLDAAYGLIKRNHPGAAKSLQDPDFKRRLQSGYREARVRAKRVDSFAGYAATLRGFANVFKDGHIWAHLLYRPLNYRWAGLIVSKAGEHWTVSQTAADQGALKSATLLRCDGKSIEELGRQRLGSFRADWTVPAQQVAQAPWLLIDDDNPFLPLLHVCEFKTAHETISRELNWREITREELGERLKMASGTGKAGYSVRNFSGGTWIGLEGLGDKAPPVIAQVRAEIDDIRTSRLVVVDLRGNGGGATEYGVQLAQALLGNAYVSAFAKAAADADCPTPWRVSPGNIATIRNYRRRLGPTLGADFVRQMDELLAASSNAVKNGHEFTGPIHCTLKVSKVREQWPAHFKLLVVTDTACFSSCLLVTDGFRRLGAIHVGQSTDASTRYMEVREERLPSKLAMFSTLQSVATGSPPKIGPFVPAVPFVGDIADTVALEHWIASSF